MDLTPEIIDKLCSYVKLGANVDTAALAEGIRLDILEGWLERGRMDVAGDIHSELIHRIAQARAQGEILHIHRIIEQGGARESQWILERMYPEKWAPKKIESSPKQQSTARVLDAAFKEIPAGRKQKVIGRDHGKKK